MNPYDKAHELARELSRSTECMEMQRAKEAILEDTAATAMMNDFHDRQIAIYQAYERGESPAPEKMAEIQALLGIMRQNSLLAAYLQADERVGRLVNDIQKIIVDGIGSVRWSSHRN